VTLWQNILGGVLLAWTFVSVALDERRRRVMRRRGL
jgi:hypothetical protein